MAEWDTGDNPTSNPVGDGNHAVQADGWDGHGNGEAFEAPRKQRVRKGDIEK